jgi:hypothetical protein
MNSADKIHSPRAAIALAASLAALFAALAFANPARAADPVFPPGSNVGLVPPSGMTPSRAFMGFEDPAENAAILIGKLPDGAYAEIEKTAGAGELKKQGLDFEKRDPLETAFGKGFLVIATQATDKARIRKWIALVPAQDLTVLVTVQAPDQSAIYTDTVVRAALATLAVRATVPDEERLSLLPFTVGDMAGFHVDSVLPGRALMLIDPVNDPSNEASKDASANPPGSEPDARFLIAAAPGGPTEPRDRTAFARAAFEQIGGIKDIQITMAEPIRINSQSGFETVAAAKASQTGAAVTVVQWLRFGSGGFMQMIGVVRTEHWPDTLKRMRTVRDSIDSK